MKKLTIAVVVLIAVGIATYYLVFNKNTGTYYTPSTSTTDNMEMNTPVNTESPTPEAQTPPATPSSTNVTVNIKNFAFNPSTLTIKTGTKVTWVNNDSIPHTVTSDSGNVIDSG